MITRVLRLLLERRLFRLGQRTGTLVHTGAPPSGNEPFDDPAHFGDAPNINNVINFTGRN